MWVWGFVGESVSWEIVVEGNSVMFITMKTQIFEGFLVLFVDEGFLDVFVFVYRRFVSRLRQIFFVVKLKIQRKCLLVGKWIISLWYINRIKYYVDLNV